MADTKHIGSRVHPMVNEAKELMENGKMDRREFVRLAALLGVSAGTAYAMAGVPVPAAAAESNLPFPPVDPNAKAGGTLRVAMQVQKVEDPALFSWVEMGNQARHVIEYISMTGPDNITRPMLAESWTASDDLKTWDIKLREGVLWHNGDELVADHIIWNIKRWLDPDLAAGGIIGLSTFSAMVEDKDGKKVEIPGSVEAVDKYTVRFNLKKPVLSVAEDCYNYPTAILHPSFTSPFSANPMGTGPFTMTENVVGERCILKRVTKTGDGKDFTYWGGDVYLDEIHYYNFDEDNMLTAYASGDVDGVYEVSVEQLEFAKALEGEILAARTAQTLCCRMQVDQAPFDNIKVREAVIKSVDNGLLKALVYPEGGDVGQNHHVAPIHPEYFDLPPLERDVDGAKQALAEAGHEGGIELTIDVGNTDGPWHQTLCEANARPDAGIRHQAEYQRSAAVQILGDLGQDAVRRNSVDAPSARNDGAVARLPDRGAVERNPFQEPGIRRGP